MVLSAAQVQQFKIDGYLLLPALINSSQLTELRSLTSDHLAQRIKPYELESEVKYPGAPTTLDAVGGDTIRRLSQAFSRHSCLAKLAKRSEIIGAIQQILDCKHLFLNPNHHNCVMTKLPEYSSETLWHRDTRYWNFDNKYLINAWTALGDELEENGAMKVLPGSHRWEVQEDALDQAQFLKLDHAYNQDRLATQRIVTLNAGDVLLFSAHCFHAAGKNRTELPKFSAVFTYHGEETKPVPDTHSSSTPEIQLS